MRERRLEPQPGATAGVDRVGVRPPIGGIVGKYGRAYAKHSGCCFEPQHFPDSPNHPCFKSTVLKPGEQYAQTTVFKFAVE